MKKLISLVILFTIFVGCEVRPVPVRTTVIVESYDCELNPSDLRWATYCEGSCCYQQYYDSGWLCEEAWCYDYYYCGWEYVGNICY